MQNLSQEELNGIVESVLTEKARFKSSELFDQAKDILKNKYGIDVSVHDTVEHDNLQILAKYFANRGSDVDEVVWTYLERDSADIQKIYGGK